MFTADGLLEIAMQESPAYIGQAALQCAAHLERSGASVKSIGPFDTTTVKPGDRVRVLKGAQIRSLHPKWRGIVKHAGTTYTVTVSHVFPGYVNYNVIHNTRISWAGEGGYWCETDINNVEIVCEA